METDFEERGFLARSPFPAPHVARRGNWKERLNNAGPPIEDRYDEAFRKYLLNGTLSTINDLSEVV